MPGSPDILIVDDDVELCEMLVRYLNEDGFGARAVHDGQRALEALRATRYDAVVLDVMMPGMSGQEVLRRLQLEAIDKPPVPVLMLTARGDEVDRVIGLETGADDYLAKPCSLRELAARLRAILRRASRAQELGRPNPTTVVGDIRVNAAQRTAERSGQRLNLTGAEFSVLQSLMESAGYTVSKEDLTRIALGREFFPEDRSIDVHIAHLRKKLGNDESATHIKTMRGVGYVLLPGSDD